ncbi:MAG: sigma 54-interacting transcriptional regulator [Firmicutes bacterium]|nr:sigma 54-interacting transcriptional regulator [Bacillota bacterium]
MQKRKIAILTYQDKFELYDDQFREEFENTEVIQYGSDFSYDILVKKAKMLEQLGYDAIIARGYTYGLIKPHVNLPIIMVEPDMVDVLASLIKLTPKTGERIGLLLQNSNNLLHYENLPAHLRSIFGVETEVYNYENMDDYFPCVDEILMKKQILFSGHNGIKRTREMGGKCAPLYIGENAMRNAIVEAIKIIDIRANDANQNQKIETILSNKNEGIINIDGMFHVEWINDYAKEILDIPSEMAIEDIKIEKYIPSIDWNNVLNYDFKNVIVKTEGNNRIIMNTKVVINTVGEHEVFIFFRQTANVVEEEKKIRAELHKKKQYAKFNLDDIKGNSRIIAECKERTKQCAGFNSNILIYGESGVGKELFAQCIHNESERRKEPFYAVNCAALPENLLESELFGYSEGSFTGAKKGGKAGIFELAHRGTVFLDEIGELSLASQSALLRVLQEREVRRIGDDGIIPVDVRVIAASHKDIYREVEEKRFRRDLFYRLSTVFLTIPPLRERRGDITELMDTFITDYAEKFQLEYTATLDAEAYQYLLRYPWEGNVRELQNFVQRIFVLGYYNRSIHAEDVKLLLANSPKDMGWTSHGEKASTVKAVEVVSRRKLTMEEILHTLQQTNGNKTEAAKILGISRTHLWRLLQERG